MSILPPSSRVTSAPTPGLDHLLDAGRIADRAGAGVLEALLHRLLDDAHHILRAARGGVVAMVGHDDGAAVQRLGARHLDRQRLGMKEKAFALLPGGIEDLVQQDLALGRALVADDHRGERQMRDVGLREAAEHRSVQHLAGVLGLVGHAHQGLHRLARGRVDQRAAHDRAVAPHHPRLDLARERAHQGAAGATGRVGHVDMRIGAVAGDDGRALDHGVGHLRVKIERHRDRHVGRDLADAIEEFAFAVVIVLGHHGAVQRQQHGVAALLDLVDDCRRHLLVGGLGHQTRGMRRCRHRHGEFGACLAGDFDESAERGVGALGFRDGRRPAQGAGAGERFDRSRQRRERIGLVHHHRDCKFLRQFPLPPLAKPLSNLQICVQCADRHSFAHAANLPRMIVVRCKKATP